MITEQREVLALDLERLRRRTVMKTITVHTATGSRTYTEAELIALVRLQRAGLYAPTTATALAKAA